MYAGFPETTYIDTLLAVVWIGWRASCLRRVRLAAFASKVSAGVIVGLLLSAPLLLAFVNYLGNADLGVHGSIVGGVTIPARGLAMLFMPYVFGPIFAYNDPAGVVNSLWKGVGGYLTTSLLLFALFGLLSRRTRALKLILLGWIILVLARTYGEPPLLGHVLGVVPGMSHVAFYRYAFPSLELPVVILAALGLDDLARQPRSLRRIAGAMTVTLLIVVAAILAAAPIDHQLPIGHSLYSHVAAVWAVSAVVLAGIATLAPTSRLRTTLVALVIGVDVLAPFVTAQLSTPHARLDLAPVRYLQRHLGLQRFFTMGPIAPNYGSYFGLAELNAADLPLPSSFTRYVHSRLDPYTDPLYFVGNDNSGRPITAPSTQQVLIANLASFRDAGVAYVLTPPGQRLPQSSGGFQLVFQSPSTWIYHLAGAAPYFSASNHSCQITARDRQAVRLRCPSPSILLRRETDFSGWSAHTNGRTLKVGQADDIFQAVNVPAGTHEITFSYTPPGSTWALIAVLVAFGWLITAAVIRRKTPASKDRRAPTSPVA